MRTLLMILAIAVLGTSVAGQRPKIVIHANEIRSVCADDSEVELVACTRTSPPISGLDWPELEFKFPTVPSGEVAFHMSISYVSYGDATVTVRFRFQDSKTATAVAAFIEAHRAGGCNPSISPNPSMPPNPDGPYASVIANKLINH